MSQRGAAARASESPSRRLPPRSETLDLDSVPPPPRLRPREINEFKGPKFAVYRDCVDLPIFDGIEPEIPIVKPISAGGINQSPAETRLESFFQPPFIYQARDPKAAARDKDLAGFYNARIVNIRTAINSGAFDLVPSGESQSAGVRFDSHFECGNLECVTQTGEDEYNLLLQNDINSRGHIQWFFFKVSNTTSGRTLKLNLLNFIKSTSLFSAGMRVSTYSLQSRQRVGTGWTRSGDEIAYFRNGIKRSSRSGSYYTLSFKYTFPYSDDEVYFAYSCPYTYTRVQRLLETMETDTGKNQLLFRKTLCQTIGGNQCDYLTITNPSSEEEWKRKKGVLLTARAHPGETVGSWVMEGILDFLTGDSPEARFLRDKYVFRILPMLNPDGVVNGNYRCGLLGVDLNRRWLKPSKAIHPIESQWKQQAKLFASKRPIELICDLHGHSRRLGAFMYGCTVPSEPHRTRLFPYILSKLCPAFQFGFCSFGVQPSKEKTQRATLFRELAVANVYTLETSFCGPVSPSTHYTTSDLKSIGRCLCLALLINYSDFPSLPSEVPLPAFSKDSAARELLSDETLLHTGEEEDPSGSDSSPSEDELESDIIAQVLPIRAKSKVRGTIRVLRRPKKVNVFPMKSKSPPEKAPESSGEIPYVSRSPDRIPQAEGHSAPLRPRDPLIRPYLSPKGKRVRDQMTQTPVSFYLAYKLQQQSESKSDYQRTSLVVSDKFVGGVARLDVSMNAEKKSTLDDVSLEVYSRPLLSISPKKALVASAAPSSKPDQSHLRDLSYSCNSKMSLDLTVESKFQQILGLSAAPKARVLRRQHRN